MNKQWRPAEETPSAILQPLASKRKKLRVVKRQTGEKLPQEVILDGVFHELRNCLQSIGIGADLLQLGHPETVESRTIALGIERAGRLLREVQEYCFPPEPHLSTRTLREVLTETIQTLEREGTETRFQLHYPEKLPPFCLDWLILGRIFERVFRCACGVLPSKGGEVLVDVRVYQEQTRIGVEIQTAIHGKGELEVDEDRIFTPFWRVGNYYVGLGLMLARQTMQSYNGQLTFKKTNPSHAHFSLLLDILPETIVSMEAEQEEDHVYVE